jgi:hypothetical protein
VRSRICLSFLVVLWAIGSAFGQWEVTPSNDSRVEPIYPTRPYSFHEGRANYDPYQFNWYSGRWDYVPIPYDYTPPGQTAAPYRPTWEINTNQTPGRPAVPQQTAAPAPAPAPAPEKTTDTELWILPTTQPFTVGVPKVIHFTGKVVSVRAANLAGERYPHLLMCLRNATGATATVDVGERLEIPQTAPGTNPLDEVDTTAKLGDVDGSPVLFPDEIKLGNQTVKIDRPGNGTPPK